MIDLIASHGSPGLLWCCWLPGSVPGKARPRTNTRTGRVHLPTKYARWKITSAAYLRVNGSPAPAAPLSAPLRAEIQITVSAPRSRPPRGATARDLYYPPTKAPSRFPWVPPRSDLDNAAGSILDALTDGGIIIDDRIIGSLTVTLYASHLVEHIGANIQLFDLVVS